MTLQKVKTMNKKEEDLEVEAYSIKATIYISGQS